MMLLAISFTAVHYFPQSIISRHTVLRSTNDGRIQAEGDAIQLAVQCSLSFFRLQHGSFPSVTAVDFFCYRIYFCFVSLKQFLVNFLASFVFCRMFMIVPFFRCRTKTDHTLLLLILKLKSFLYMCDCVYYLGI